MEVSVVTPVYNAERHLEDAVRSALAQPETAEVILVEDGSQDASLAMCRRLATEDGRVTLAQHPDGKNRGAAESRNVGIRLARCQYVAFLDADDFFLPNRFHAARQLLESDPTIDGVYEAIGSTFESDTLREFWLTRGERELYTMDEPIPPEELFETLVRGTKGEFHTNGLTVHKRIFERSGLFDSHLRMCQDTAMWIKMAATGRLVAGSLSEPVSMRRFHDDNRIYKHRDRHTSYRIEMYHTLIRWGRSGTLAHSDTALLLETLMNEWYWQLPKERGWTGYRLRLHWLLFLLNIARRYPFAIGDPVYRHRLSQATGWHRVTASLRSMTKR